MASQIHILHSQRPWPGNKPYSICIVLFTSNVTEGFTHTHTHTHTHTQSRTSTQLVVGAVTVEVVTLAELSAVAFLRVLPLLALTGSTHAVSVVAADVRAVVLAAVLVHVLAGHLVGATLTLSADPPLVTPGGGAA